MDGLKQSGAFEIKPEGAEGDPQRVPRRPRRPKRQVAATIRETLAETGYLLDPHTGDRRLRRRARTHKPASPMVTLVDRASGQIPGRGKIRLRY